MSSPTAVVSPAHRTLTRARLRALQQVLVLGGLFNLGLESVAHAAPVFGQGMLSFIQTSIVVPVGLMALIVAIGGALFRPEMVSKAIYTALLCAVLFFVLSNGGTVMQALSS